MTLFKKLLLYIKPRTLHRSDDGHIEIRDAIENGRPVRVLWYDDVRESGIYLDDGMNRDPLFYYMQTLKEILLFYEGLSNALLIGGGGMAFPKYYLDCIPDGRMTVVEKDDLMLRLAGEYFFFREDSRISVHAGDGASFIRALAMNMAAGDRACLLNRYSLIIFDAFVGNKPPKELFSEGMFKLTRQIMTEDGILAINMVNEKPGVLSMQTHLAQAVLKNIFKNTRIINCKMGWNCILMASDRALTQ